VIEIVNVDGARTLDEYAGYVQLSAAVQELRAEVEPLLGSLADRTIWMVNSTAKGGGVAEMLPRQIAILNELGIRTKWAVIGTDRSEFFALTKHIHNLIHGAGEPTITDEQRRVYDEVSEQLAEDMDSHVSAGDILVVHDPQPLGMGALLRRRHDIRAVWRCHIGLDEDLPQTRAAWAMLEPLVHEYDRVIFSAPEYIPERSRGRVTVITPAIDPLAQKNRPLSAHELVGVLCNAGLSIAHTPVLTPSFSHLAERLRPDGSFGPATEPDEIGLLTRPIVTQISRWDRLKGFRPLLEAFAKLKREFDTVPGISAVQQKRIALTRLVMAGPESKAVADDPEAREVLDDLRTAYMALEPDLQRDVVMLSLPMASLRENALMVNAIQRCSSIVVQNSLREGFGLTVTEPMWKGVPVLGAAACGIRQQIRDGIDGRLLLDARDVDGLASNLYEMLDDQVARRAFGRQGQRRVNDQFLIFAQLRRWARLLAAVADMGSLAPPRPSVFPSSTPAGGFRT
jgi:trehalose synthase